MSAAIIPYNLKVNFQAMPAAVWVQVALNSAHAQTAPRREGAGM